MTERARTHMQHLEREQLFSALVEHSPDIIARIDRELRHVYVNPAVATVTGVTPEQLIGKTDRQLGVPLELCVRWAAGARRAFATGRQQEIEITFPTPEGERHYMSHMVPELGADGQVESVLAIARDITERKHAELALRASESKLRRTQHEFETLGRCAAAGDQLLRPRAEIHLRQCGDRSRDGLSRAAMIGRTNTELGLPAAPVEQWEESLRRVFETGPAVEHRDRVSDARRSAAIRSAPYTAHARRRHRRDRDRRRVRRHRPQAGRERAPVAHVAAARHALFREVHHRVKNNLQGVVGLLRQLANMHGTLAPLLDKAISQLQAMAVVHGLHGRELRDGVILDGLVAEITKSVERTTGVPIWYNDEPRERRSAARARKRRGRRGAGVE